jgi:hypothetical protein
MVLRRHPCRQNVLSAACRSINSAALLATFLLGVGHAAVAPPPLLPDDGNTFDFYVADQELYDSNLYRLPSNIGSISTLVSPNAKRSDLINTPSVGGDGQWIAGRQIFELNLRADENRFARNDNLNNASGYGNLLLNWQVGAHFSGQAQVTYNHGLAGFDQTLFLGRDLTNTVNYLGTARYQVGPRWAIYGGVSDLEVSHSAPQARFNDYHLKQGDAGLELATSPEDTYALEYSYSDGGYPPSTFNGLPLATDFHEQLIRLLVKYALTAKTAIDAYAGYRSRDFTATGQRAFAGAVGRLGVNWQPTDKTQLLFAGWRELRSYANAESSYFVSQGGSISPVWTATEKLKFTLLFSYEKQDFISQSTTVIVLGALNAKIATEQLNITFSPRSAWIFNLSFNHQKRDSNLFSYQFDDDLASVSVLYKIH